MNDDIFFSEGWETLISWSLSVLDSSLLIIHVDKIMWLILENNGHILKTTFFFFYLVFKHFIENHTILEEFLKPLWCLASISHSRGIAVNFWQMTTISWRLSLKTKITIVVGKVFFDKSPSISDVFISILDHILTFFDHSSFSSFFLEHEFNTFIDDFSWIIRILMIVVLFELFEWKFKRVYLFFQNI